jgi:hypothetical protein
VDSSHIKGKTAHISLYNLDDTILLFSSHIQFRAVKAFDVAVLALTLLTAVVSGAPAPQLQQGQGPTILVPVNQLAQTQIQGVSYIILPANNNNGGQQFNAPGRFFLRSAVPGPAPFPQQVHIRFSFHNATHCSTCSIYP